jgi:hypothetical protein
MLLPQVHETSVLHVFNAKKKPGLKRVMLPDSNRGMQILKGMGWDEEAGGGLGVSEQGHVQPVKSALKLDRAGLGARQYQVCGGWRSVGTTVVACLRVVGVSDADVGLTCRVVLVVGRSA